MKRTVLASLMLSVVSLIAVGQVDAASYTLYAGRSIDVGTVDVTSDGTYIYVTFNTTDGWLLALTQSHVAGTLAGIPQTRRGNPMPGHFAGQSGWLGGATSYTETFPIADLGGKDVFVAAHAIVGRITRTCIQIESAWAGDSDFPGHSWANYIAVAAGQWVSTGSGWDITGDWTFALFDGIYPHDLTLTQDAGGAVTGDGHLMTTDDPPVEAQYVTVTGSVVESTVNLTVVYPDSGGYSFMLEGTIASGGTLTGTSPDQLWSWYSSDGAAVQGGGTWTLP